MYDAEASLILTNEHVPNNATQIRVTLSDSRETYAGVMRTDLEMDLALLKVNLPNLTETKIGDSDVLRVGEKVDVRYVRDGEWLENYEIVRDQETRRISGAERSYLPARAEFENSAGSGRTEDLGIVASSVEEGSMAWISGMRKGEFVFEVNRT